MFSEFLWSRRGASVLKRGSFFCSQLLCPSFNKQGLLFSRNVWNTEPEAENNMDICNFIHFRRSVSGIVSKVTVAIVSNAISEPTFCDNESNQSLAQI